MAWRGGADPRPGIPSLALGALACGTDFPAPLVLRQPLDRFLAGQLRPAGQRDHEVRRDPQHAGLTAGFEELAQLGAAAVDLVPAGKVEGQPVGVRASEDVDGQLAPGAERQVRRQPGDQRLDRVLDVLARDPLPGPDQRVPGALPHVAQVHGVDPVRHPARAPHVLAVGARRGTARLLLTGLVDRADRHPAAPAPPRCLLKPGHGEPPHHAHRRGRVPDRVVQQPLGLVRRPVPGMPGNGPPVHPRQLAGQRRHVLARLQPRLCAGKTRPQQPHQLGPFPKPQPGAYPCGSSRL